MPVFGKKENCPTSHELLSFSNGEVADGRIRVIRWHLTFCDFCAAELELYIQFPPTDQTVEVSAMPRHLRELAESILKKKQIDVIEVSDKFGPS
jgi:hypothetical protein